MLYGFCDLYASQLASGKEYQALNPTIGIWLLGSTHFKTSDTFFHHFQLADLRDKELWEPENGIYGVELSKWQKNQVKGKLDRWTRFFRDGKDLDDAALPEYMDTSEMRQGMETLNMFSEKEREYHAYQDRMNDLRQQRTIQLEREEERQQIEAEKQRAEAAERELARMKEMLIRAGIDPETV